MPISTPNVAQSLAGMQQAAGSPASLVTGFQQGRTSQINQTVALEQLELNKQTTASNIKAQEISNAGTLSSISLQQQQIKESNVNIQKTNADIKATEADLKRKQTLQEIITGSLEAGITPISEKTPGEVSGSTAGTWNPFLQTAKTIFPLDPKLAKSMVDFAKSNIDANKAMTEDQIAKTKQRMSAMLRMQAQYIASTNTAPDTKAKLGNYAQYRKAITSMGGGGNLPSPQSIAASGDEFAIENELKKANALIANVMKATSQGQELFEGVTTTLSADQAKIDIVAKESNIYFEDMFPEFMIRDKDTGVRKVNEQQMGAFNSILSKAATDPTNVNVRLHTIIKDVRDQFVIDINDDTLTLVPAGMLDIKTNQSAQDPNFVINIIDSILQRQGYK